MKYTKGDLVTTYLYQYIVHKADNKYVRVKAVGSRLIFEIPKSSIVYHVKGCPLVRLLYDT